MDGGADAGKLLDQGRALAVAQVQRVVHLRRIQRRERAVLATLLVLLRSRRTHASVQPRAATQKTEITISIHYRTTITSLHTQWFVPP